ncbi:hypothetical protein CAPTEDRAFT_226950 [Capitella teleta]|uniref:U6 snRNA phosphodiesterase 1 n=1 Tax=Capitella teleta TaxID=283909 RepID=R7UWT5_CAPTE|nr:hypothetical protein CAPTEDRAFT_226950 [Capitella teleta]|eukprot:ELU10712.1 hypothetical protein CAPTEDRAFT_226950 [Capitella teleta]
MEFQFRRPPSHSRVRGLPLPSGIQSMFASKQEEPTDNPDHHDGRIRSFGHERGNWASHVFIATDASDQLRQLTCELLKSLPGEFRCMEDFHLSLSKTFIVRHHWIKDLLSSLKKQLASCQRCCLCFQGVDFLVNEEGTRTFMVLKTCSGFNILTQYVASVDAALSEYKLPAYYQDPSFHISLAWALGDVKKQISEELLSCLRETTAEFLEDSSDCAILEANTLVFRTGNRQYDIELRSS